MLWGTLTLLTHSYLFTDLTVSTNPHCSKASVTMATMTSAAYQWSGFVHEWVNEKRKWRIKKRGCRGGTRRNRRGGGKKQSVPILISLLYVTRATAACRPAWRRSIPEVDLIDEARALGHPAHVCASIGSAPPHLSSYFLCPYATNLMAKCNFIINDWGFAALYKEKTEYEN